MKKMKTLASLVLALVLAMALTVPAFADDNPGTITIKNPDETPADATHTYNIYRVFEMTKNGDAVSYTATNAIKQLITGATGDYEDVADYFTFPVQDKDGKWSVIPSTTFQEAGNNSPEAKLFAKFLQANSTSLTKIGNAITLTGKTQQAVNVPYGYYFVDSTVGSLLMLDSTNPTVTIEDKNYTPTIGKQDTTDYANNNIEIGDDLDYTITINVVPGSTDYVLHDTLGAGLQLKADSFAIKVDNADVAETNYTLDTDNEGIKTTDDTFAIKFPASYLSTIPNKAIVVTYKATILDTAAIPNGSQTIVLGNDASLSYGTDKTTSVHEDSNLYQFDLVKTNDQNQLLDGAVFELYDGKDVTVTKDKDNKDVYTLDDNATPIRFTLTGNTYKVDPDGTAASLTVTNGKVNVVGLKGIYYLKETKAPAGYNQLTTLSKVDLSEGNSLASADSVTGGARVVNQSGAELPSTGGMGTTLFYTIGGLLVVCSAILIVTKKRMSSIA